MARPMTSYSLSVADGLEASAMHLTKKAARQIGKEATRLAMEVLQSNAAGAKSVEEQVSRLQAAAASIMLKVQAAVGPPPPGGVLVAPPAATPAPQPRTTQERGPETQLGRQHPLAVEAPAPLAFRPALPPAVAPIPFAPANVVEHQGSYVPQVIPKPPAASGASPGPWAPRLTDGGPRLGKKVQRDLANYSRDPVVPADSPMSEVKPPAESSIPRFIAGPRANQERGNPQN